MSKFGHLFEPITIRNVTYKNRIIAGPTFKSVDAFVEGGEDKLRIMEERARGGAAEVIVGETRVNGSDAARSVRADALDQRIGADAIQVDYTNFTDRYFALYCEYAARIHKYGAVALCELMHPGDKKTPAPGEPNPWGPVGYLREDGVTVEAFDREKMDKVANDFGQAALYMKKAGFDGVLTHSGHGWLFTQFLSKRTNRRTDEYGGDSMENRARFPLEIWKAIRKYAGEDFIIEARLNGEEMVEGGITIDDTVELCRILEREKAVDIIHVSMGQYYSPARTHEWLSAYSPHGANVVYAEAIKRAVKTIPVAVIGGFNGPELADQYIAEGKTDFVVYGRQMFADPDMPNKSREGREAEIRRCVRCFHCYLGKIEHPDELYEAEHMGITPSFTGIGKCSLNPRAEIDPDSFPKPAGTRRVLIAGGGISGLEAAIEACDRGHKVTLAEKSGRLGGVLSYTDYEDYKADLKNFRDLLIRAVEKRKIEVLKHTEVTPEYIRDFAPDALVVAVGAHPFVPPIPGVEKAVPVLEVYKEGALTTIGKKVVIVGGGLAGCECAIHLAREGRSVTVVEMKHRMAPETHQMPFTTLMDEMDRYDITKRAYLKCLEFTDDGIEVESVADGRKEHLEADTVILSMGMRKDAGAVNALVEAGPEGSTYAVGDCDHVAQVYDAVKSGFVAAMSIR